MNEEIKEILDRLKDEDDYIEEYGFRYKRIALDDVWYLLDYITNLQQDLDKANDIIEKDRQFNKGRLLDIAKLKEENEELNRMCEIYSKSLYNAELTDYKSRTDKAIEEIKRVLDIWENKPNEIATLDLEYLLNILQGSDEE